MIRTSSQDEEIKRLAIRAVDVDELNVIKKVPELGANKPRKYKNLELMWDEDNNRLSIYVNDELYYQAFTKA
jgi:hypothetical protein